MKKLSLILLGALAVSGQVAAQTCASPLPIFSNPPVSTAYTGDTCTATNTLPGYGGVGSTQNEIVYSFVAQNANAQISIAATGGFSGTTAGVFLLPSCNSATADPIAFGTPSGAMTVSGLTNGQTYYVAVTADPGGAPAGCGQYSVTVNNGGILPVALQKFSVE
jgi:hypothetical protein